MLLWSRHLVVTRLYIHPLPLNLGKKRLWQAVCCLVERKTITKLHKQLNYAFIHFDNRESAEKGKEALQNLPYPGIIVEWSRPREYSKQQRLESPPTNFCISTILNILKIFRSLPPKLRRHYKQYINSILSETSSCSLSEISDESCLSENKLDKAPLSMKEIKQIQYAAKAAIAASKPKDNSTPVDQSTLPKPILKQQMMMPNSEEDYFSKSSIQECLGSGALQDSKWLLEEKPSNKRAISAAIPRDTTGASNMDSKFTGNFTTNALPGNYVSRIKNPSISLETSPANLSLYEGLSYFNSSNDEGSPSTSCSNDSFLSFNNNTMSFKTDSLFLQQQKPQQPRPIENVFKMDDFFDFSTTGASAIIKQNRLDGNPTSAFDIAGPKLRALWDFQ